MYYSSKTYSSNYSGNSLYSATNRKPEFKKMTCCNSRLRGQQCPNCPYR